MMTRQELARKNLELLEIFTQQMIEDERFAKRSPKGAAVSCCLTTIPNWLMPIKNWPSKRVKMARKLCWFD